MWSTVVSIANGLIWAHTVKGDSNIESKQNWNVIKLLLSVKPLLSMSICHKPNQNHMKNKKDNINVCFIYARQPYLGRVMYVTRCLN